ncbi:MAG TPA: tyrosine--tRNA ligase [Solirubrobacteraceae bacterium]|nr:tyrosine--tRNA ligase [Solirubrobacteraceae bacterium]
MRLWDELVWRGLVQDRTEGLGSALESPLTLYAGYDPTAPSLHAGNLQLIVTMRRFREAGHTVIALAGGGTGLIGDPSGKSGERALQEESTVREWAARIEGQIRRLLGGDAIYENNRTWLEPLTAIDLLRDVGKHFPMGYMLAKESVKTRVHGEGMTFTEFAYMLLQAYDYVQLYDRHDCRLQIGGSDQWGNITAGVELCKRTRRPGAYGMTTPLLLRADGQKFGKSEEGAIWLDPERTSPYGFFQFFLNTADDQVGTLLRRLSLLPREEIERLEAAPPETRTAQRALADHLTRMVHGEEGLRQAQEQTEALFGGEGQAHVMYLDTSAVVSWAHLFQAAGLVSSLSEARRLIKGGGLYVGDERVTEATPLPDVAAEDVLLLRKGKRERRAVRLGG